MSNITRIKICGITNIEDARAAIDYGADAIGFIFVPDTPRYIADRHSSILPHLPPFISRVAVCNDPTDISLHKMLQNSDFDAVQFYRTDVSATELPAGKRRICALRIKNEASLDEIERVEETLQPQAFLLDTYHPDRLGGAGATFNWDLAIEAKRRFSQPIILAGGLTPDNVAEAVRLIRPYAVDVSSGVEAEPGRKDHAKLYAFIQAVRNLRITG